MTSKLKTDVLETVSGSGTIALTNQLSGMTYESMPSGSVLQVLIVEDSSVMSVSATTYVDTNMSLSITPSSTSSKILCLWNVQARMQTAQSGFGTQLVRGSTNIWTSGTNYNIYCGSATDSRVLSDFKYLDSPSTTSAITYKVQVQPHNNITINFNEGGNKAQLVLMEIKG